MPDFSRFGGELPLPSCPRFNAFATEDAKLDSTPRDREANLAVGMGDQESYVADRDH